MATTLQELRKEAGYRTAKDFAEAIDVPPTTYARYEQSPEKIPLKQAWMIADFLGCSIDAVVGREHIDITAMRGDIQRFHDSLSPDNKVLHEDFLDFLALREENAAERRAETEKLKYMQIAQYYEESFMSTMVDKSVRNSTPTVFMASRLRSKFERYLREKFAQQAEADLQEYTSDLDDELWKEAGLDPSLLEMTRDLPEELESEIVSILDKLETGREKFARNREQEDREVIEKIMDGYDALHPEHGSSVKYYSMRLR